MPFQSKSQLRTCYSKHSKKWNCDKWLKETPSLCDLPEFTPPKSTKSIKPKTRTLRQGEIVKGKIQTGPRGGRFFLLTQGKCVMKVYLPTSKK